MLFKSRRINAKFRVEESMMEFKFFVFPQINSFDFFFLSFFFSPLPKD